MGSTVVCLILFYRAMQRYEKRTIYFVGLAAYSPFPLALFLVEKTMIHRFGVWIVYFIGAISIEES